MPVANPFLAQGGEDQGSSPWFTQPGQGGGMGMGGNAFAPPSSDFNPPSSSQQQGGGGGFGGGGPQQMGQMQGAGQSPGNFGGGWGDIGQIDDGSQ